MKRASLVVILLLAVVGVADAQAPWVTSPPNTTRPVSFGAQWYTRGPSRISYGCTDPNDGGLSCVTLSQSLLHGFTWQSTTKAPADVLIALVVEWPGQPALKIMNTFHGVATPGESTRTVMLPIPMVLPDQARVWIWASGWAADKVSPASIEVMVTLWLEDY